MKILNHDIQAVIFDMDGTLIDSTSIWHKIDEDFFAKRGIDHVPENYAHEIVHLGLKKGAEMTIKRFGFTNDTIDGIIKEWQDASRQQYEKEIPLKEGALEILKYYKSKGIKIALATANDKALYEPCLKRLDIASYFDLIIDVDLVKEGKKSPKIFDYVSDKFAIKRENIMVVEDSLISLITAYKAGYFVTAVYDKSSSDVDDKKKENSHIYVNSLTELIALSK